MELKNTAAACVLSLAAVMLISPLLSRAGKRGSIFSAALGIILYRIVKSIIVECGWGFAAAAGIRQGLALEALAMCCGIVLFGELGRNRQTKTRTMNLPAASVIMLCAGKGLLCQANLIPSDVEFILGRAAGIALTAIAVYIADEDMESPDAQSLSSFAAVCAARSFAAEWLLGLFGCRASSPAAPFLIMLGCCELMVVFAGGVKNHKEAEPWGFAAGLLLSYGFDSLTG